MPDEVFGIVGGSGTGKSVLLRTILGPAAPAGRRRAHRRPRHHADDARRSCAPSSRTTGSSFQAGALYSGLTVKQNIQLPMLEYLKLSERRAR